MKTVCTLAGFAALFAALATSVAATAETIRDCDRPNHYILSKCEDELRLEWAPVPDSLLAHGKGHAATLLEDGRVLVVGGRTSSYDEATRSWFFVPTGAEVYDPATRTWSLTAPMNVSRVYGIHAIRLLDGRVLVLGGESLTKDLEGSAEVFDPATGTWTRTANLVVPRVAFTATLLSHGEVLVAGGVAWDMDTDTDTIAIAEIYNPESGTWRTAGSMRESRYGHAATLLPDGRVLVAGGNSDSFFDYAALTAEVFDPETEKWYPAGDITQGWLHTATSLDNGRVLVAGGTQHDCPRGFGGMCSETNVETTRLYEPHSGTWLDTGTLIAPRFDHVAVAIPGHGVLLVGGRVGTTPVPYYSVAPVEQLELFDLFTWSWREVAAINELPASASSYYSATPLADGTVLLIGEVEGKRVVQLKY
jgi:hypothetical protein